MASRAALSNLGTGINEGFGKFSFVRSLKGNAIGGAGYPGIGQLLLTEAISDLISAINEKERL